MRLYRLPGLILLRCAALLCFACACCSMNVSTSFFNLGNFRAATLTWRRIAPSVVTASLVSTWATDYSAFRSLVIGDVVEVAGISNPVLRFGDGRSVIVLNEVVSTNPLTSSWTGVFAVNISYAPSSGSRFTLEFSGCCRASYLTFGALSPFNVTAQVDLQILAAPSLAVLPRLQVQPSTHLPISFTDVAPGDPPVRIFFPPEATGFDEQSLQRPVQHMQSFFSISGSSIIFSLPLLSLSFLRLCSTFSTSSDSTGWLASSCADMEIQCLAPDFRVSVDASSMSSISPPGPPSILERFGGFDASYIVCAPPTLLRHAPLRSNTCTGAICHARHQRLIRTQQILPRLRRQPADIAAPRLRHSRAHCSAAAGG